MLHDHVAIALHPVRDWHPRAVPNLPHLHPAAAFVILLRDGERGQEAAEREVADRLEALAHVVAGHVVGPDRLDGVGDGPGVQGADEHPAVVVHADFHLVVGCRLPFLGVHGLDLVDDLVALSDARELERLVALGRFPARCLHVGFGGRPDEADDPVHGEPQPAQLLDGDRGSLAEGVVDDPVGLVVAHDVEHLRAHVHPGRRNRELAHLEADPALNVAEHVEGLATGRVVVVQVRDLGQTGLAGSLPFVHHELDGGTGLRPVGGRDGENVGIALAVRRTRASEAGRGAGHLVGGELGRERIGVRCAVEAVAHVPRFLGAFVRFDAARHVVAVVDLEGPDRVALSEHPRLVGEADVVVRTVAEEVSDELSGPGAVALKPEHELTGGCGAGHEGGGECRACEGEGCDSWMLHCVILRLPGD